MDRLPKEVLRAILQYFQNNSNAFILRQVCRQWKNVIPPTDFQPSQIIKYNINCGHLGTLKWLYNFFPNSLLEECEIPMYAAEAGNLEILQWAHIIGHDLHEQVFERAAANGNLDILEWLKEKKCPYNYLLWEAAVFKGNRQVFLWLQENNFQAFQQNYCQSAAIFGNQLEMFKLLCHDDVPKSMIDQAISHGSEEMVKYFLDNGASFTPWSCENAALVGNFKLFVQSFSADYEGRAYSKAAQSGSFEILKWLDENGHKNINNSAVSAAAAAGHFEMVKWLVSKNAQYDHGATNGAAKCGNLEMLQWLVEKGCPIDFREIMNVAARAGKLAILEWLFAVYPDLASENTDKITYWAAERDYMHVLEWAKEQGFKFTSEISRLAAMHDHLNVLKFLKKNGFPIDEDVCQYAARSGNVTILRWLMDNGYTATPEAAKKAATCGHLLILKLLKRKGIWSYDVRQIAEKKSHLRIVRWLDSTNNV